MSLVEIKAAREKRLTVDEMKILRRCLDAACKDQSVFDVVERFAEIDKKLKAMIADSATRE